MKYRSYGILLILVLLLIGCTKEYSGRTILYGNNVTDVDGNVYQTVIIGSQVWMIDDLRTTKYNDGTTIPQICDDTNWFFTQSPGYCYYNNCDNCGYGILYNWYTVGTGKLAPTGWRIPTDADWAILENYLITNGYNYDGSTINNKIAKSLSFNDYWCSSDIAGTIGCDLTKNNTSGFSALPNGLRTMYGDFHNFGSEEIWWSSSQVSGEYAWCRGMNVEDCRLYRDNSEKQQGYSVRCILDK